jgi:antitoxin FitA
MLPPEEAADQARSIAARSKVTADDVMDTITMMRETRS